jgi:hypothetical protein
MDELVENGRYMKRGKNIRPESISATVKNEPKSVVKTTEKKVYTKVYLRVPDLESREYLKARNLVNIFEGAVRVIFYDSSNKTYLNHTSGVDLTDYVLSELYELVGKDNVVPK